MATVHIGASCFIRECAILYFNIFYPNTSDKQFRNCTQGASGAVLDFHTLIRSQDGYAKYLHSHIKLRMKNGIYMSRIDNSVLRHARTKGTVYSIILYNFKNSVTYQIISFYSVPTLDKTTQHSCYISLS